MSGSSGMPEARASADNCASEKCQRTPMKNPTDNNGSTLHDSFLLNPSCGSISRRRFLKTAVASAGALSALSLGAGAGEARRKKQALPKPNQSGIEHIIV